MSHYLPAPILAFFKPREPLEQVPLEEKKPMPAFTSTAIFMDRFKSVQPAPPPQLTQKELRAERQAETEEENAAFLAMQRKQWDPFTSQPHDGTVTRNANNTLFVSRQDPTLTEEHLKTEFESFGPVVHVHLVRDLEGKSRCYAFVEFQDSSALEDAYRQANGVTLGSRRILVDYELGRVRSNWLPRRLGGGKGYVRASVAERERIMQIERERDAERERRRAQERHKDRDHRSGNRGYGGPRRSQGF